MDLSRLDTDGDREGYVELDTHADTCVAGKNFRMLEETGEVVNVTPFSDEYKAMKNVPITTVGTAYTSPTTGETVILVGHQHLYFGDRMDHSLWNPNQIRNHAGQVFDCPKQFDLKSPFVIALKDENNQPFDIPLSLNGVVQFFETSYPTDDELDRCRRIEYTSDAPWDPYSQDFNANENAAHAYQERRLSHIAALSIRRISAVEIAANDNAFCHLFDDISVRGDSPTPSQVDSPTLSQANLLVDGDAREENRQAFAISMTTRHSAISEEDLARRWGIGIDTTKRTLRVTMQAGVQHVLHPVDCRL